MESIKLWLTPDEVKWLHEEMRNTERHIGTFEKPDIDDIRALRMASDIAQMIEDEIADLMGEKDEN